MESTSPEEAGSVTAVRTMGMSSVAAAEDWAAWVPMAKIRSTPSLTKPAAMVWQLGLLAAGVLLVLLILDSQFIQGPEESLICQIQRVVLDQLQDADLIYGIRGFRSVGGCLGSFLLRASRLGYAAGILAGLAAAFFPYFRSLPVILPPEQRKGIPR